MRVLNRSKGVLKESKRACRDIFQTHKANRIKTVSCLRTLHNWTQLVNSAMEFNWPRLDAQNRSFRRRVNSVPGPNLVRSNIHSSVSSFKRFKRNASMVSSGDSLPMKNDLKLDPTYDLPPPSPSIFLPPIRGTTRQPVRGPSQI